MNASLSTKGKEASSTAIEIAVRRLREKAIILSRLRESPLAVLGAVLVILMTLVAILAPHIAIYDPLEVDVTNRLAAPDWKHLLGTDGFGRDVWSRLVMGARVSMQVGFTAVGFGMMVGIPLGSIAGYFGGKTDQILMRVMDAFLAFPGILMALVVVAILGISLTNTMIAIGIVYIPRFARLIRSSILGERDKEYVEACRAAGQSELMILFAEVLPNCFSPLIVQATVFFAFAILTEASLSYLGLGNPPPNPSWGLMLNEARPFIEEVPILAVIPGVTISLAVLGFNLFGDGLRDILDPKTYD